ncbi:MAG: CDP-diacylglycerol--serine O-phosphatidyltransferase [Candidatus Omnitrophota bacterium]
MINLINLFTAISLASAFISIIFSLESHFTFACWAIIISVIIDGLDGQLARRYSLTSEFGKELDSLVDVVAFGVAPSILGYIFVYRHFHLYAILSLFIYLSCSVMRLAKYNITPKENLKVFFYGLPTTVSGGVLASFILIYRKYTQLPPPALFLIMVLCLSFLMVSRIRYLNLDGIKQVLKKKIVLFLIIPFALILIAFPETSIFSLFLIYLIFSPFLVRKFV